MELVKLDSFAEFEKWLDDLRNSQKPNSEGIRSFFSELLFRGHGDESWGLISTLERYSKHVTSLADYLVLAEKIRLQVELHTGAKWNSIFGENGSFREESGSRPFRADIPSLEYLVHLRHHGFPSPLLDWTRSPYIAALFAYSGCDGGDGNIAIHVYQEFNGGAKTFSGNSTFIQNIGPYIATHKRHTLQQAQYTICLKQQGNTPYGLPYDIRPHEEQNGASTHDNIYKIILPKSEKFKILAKLEQFNLNLYSILGDEDSLMSTLAMRIFNLDEI